MKTNQVICDRNGQRLVTSTTETLRIKASEIEPGDWLLKHGNRLLQKDKLVNDVLRAGPVSVVVIFELSGSAVMPRERMVDVERTR